MKSIMNTERGICYLCGCNEGFERHHIFFGTANRKKSDEYGLTVWLCPMCHRNNKRGVHGANIDAKHRLQVDGQRKFEETHSREEFIAEFGKNFITEEEE